MAKYLVLHRKMPIPRSSLENRNPETWVFDLDGTICGQTKGGDEYRTAAPNKDVISKLNWLYDIGDKIIIFTARGMKTHGYHVGADQRYRKITEDWLTANGVKYHELIFGKPAADHYIDDKAVRPDEL